MPAYRCDNTRKLLIEKDNDMKNAGKTSPFRAKVLRRDVGTFYYLLIIICSLIIKMKGIHELL